MEGIDPPRGFAFAWFKIGNANIGVYSVHLKSNLVTQADSVAETAKNIRKREIAIDQLMTHVRDFIGAKIPAINRFIIGGDFNTNHGQAMFAAEKTLDTLGTGALRNVFEKLPFEQRITHPGTNGFPDATFDYFFGKNVLRGKPIITQTNVSDHLPVTCEVIIQRSIGGLSLTKSLKPDSAWAGSYSKPRGIGGGFPQRKVVAYIPLMWDRCAGAASCVGVVVSVRTRKGSTSESLAQETSAITTTESAETRIIDFFMAGTVVDAAGQFNRRTP